MATITVDASPPGYCTLIGSTTIVNGVETGLITGVVESLADCTDNDGDVYTTCAGDCDDHNAAVHPGATEICNGTDDNCDGRIDEGFDMDNDGIADCSDNCPTAHNPDQNICACSFCGVQNITISSSSPLGKGSGLVTWNTTSEVYVIGFNVVEFTNKGERIQLNPALIRCEECMTGIGHTYTYIIPKHRGGRNIFIAMPRLFGPAQRI